MTVAVSAAVRAALAAEIAALRVAVPETLNVLVASSDGLPMVTDSDDSEAQASAIAAATLGLGQRCADLMGLGSFQENVTRGSGGYLAVYSIGEVAVLTVVAPAWVNIGLLQIQARASARAMGAALGCAPALPVPRPAVADAPWLAATS